MSIAEFSPVVIYMIFQGHFRSRASPESLFEKQNNKKNKNSESFECRVVARDWYLEGYCASIKKVTHSTIYLKTIRNDVKENKQAKQ